MDSLGQPVDISGATTKELKFTPPKGGTPKVTTAVFPTDGSKGYTGPGDGTDGYMEYVTTSAHLNAQGEWKWQGHVVLPLIGTRHTDVYTFPVAYNLT